MLGEIIAAVEAAVGLAIILTALFGSQALSERAFRLLRWLGNRPEPPSPMPGPPVSSQQCRLRQLGAVPRLDKERVPGGYRGLSDDSDPG